MSRKPSVICLFLIKEVQMKELMEKRKERQGEMKNRGDIRKQCRNKRGTLRTVYGNNVLLDKVGTQGVICQETPDKGINYK